ncbi:MAG: MFS transporter [Chlamydiia bacterium]|nr:MFS transporter [Chlamydiia bacterium]
MYGNMIRYLRNFIAPLSSVILMMMGNGFFVTFISLTLDSQGHSREQIGWVQSAYYFGMLLGAFKMEQLIKRIGHNQALAVFGSLGTCTILAMAMEYHFVAWLFFRFVAGLSLAAIYIVIESWMLAKSDATTRGIILSLYMIGLYSAQAISQQVIHFIDITSMTPYLIAAFFTSLSVIPVGLSISRVPIQEELESPPFSKLLFTSPFGATGSLMGGVVLSSLYTFYPLWGVSRNLSPQDLMTLTIGGGVIMQWPLGMLSDYFERRYVLLGIIAMIAFFCLISFMYSSESPGVIYPLSFLLGGVAFTLYPVSVTQLCDHLQPHQITKATAFLLIVYGLGAVIGPIITGAIITTFGLDTFFLLFILLMAVNAAVGIHSLTHRPHIHPDEQVNFLPLPRNTPIAYEMDPRAHEGQ